jgi:hypothetical protein
MQRGRDIYHINLLTMKTETVSETLDINPTLMRVCVPTQQIYQKLNESIITMLHLFYLVIATCFHPYFDHQALFSNVSLFIELS